MSLEDIKYRVPMKMPSVRIDKDNIRALLVLNWLSISPKRYVDAYPPDIAERVFLMATEAARLYSRGLISRKTACPPDLSISHASSAPCSNFFNASRSNRSGALSGSTSWRLVM